MAVNEPGTSRELDIMTNRPYWQLGQEEELGLKPVLLPWEIGTKGYRGIAPMARMAVNTRCDQA
jgi:hypothetical protein